jgi:hypothetical protein
VEKALLKLVVQLCAFLEGGEANGIELEAAVRQQEDVLYAFGQMTRADRRRAVDLLLELEREAESTGERQFLADFPEAFDLYD